MNINIRYHDELFMIIETSQSIEYELRDEFSFFANNYKFNPKYKYGMWDGKIRLYNSRDRTLYIGLLYDLFKFAKKNGYTISISKDDKAKFKPVVEYDEAKIEKFESEQCIYKLKPYQKASVKEAIKHNKTLILSPTGCHAKGQQVIDVDGNCIKVEDIKQDDYLLGVDGKPKRVISTFTGTDVINVVRLSDGNHHTFTDEHILSLKSEYTGQIINQSLVTYKNSSIDHKQEFKMYRKAIDFNSIVNINNDASYEAGYIIATENSFIPHAFIINSVATRMHILAGIVDVKGYCENNIIVIEGVNDELSNDIIKLCNSLGLPVIDQIGALFIYGRLAILPCRLLDVSGCDVHGSNLLDFEVVDTYQSEFFGFKIEDGLYLLDDYTVTHNSGKSLIIYTIIRYLLDSGFINENNRMLINVPNISLVTQLFQDFADYTNDDWKVSDYVTLAGGKNVEDISKCICISTWQTTIKKKPEYFENIVGYILDEAHQATASEISRIFERLTKCVFKMGTTGTLDGTDMHELGMRARFGKLYRAATTKQLMDSGDLAKLNITCKYLDYDKADVKEMWSKLRGLEPTKKYQAEIDYIINSEKRNQYLIDLAFSQKQNTLMIFNFVEKHGKMLLDKMIGLEDEKLKRVYFIYGGVGGDEREHIRTTLDKKPPVWYDLHFGKNGFIRIKAKDNVQLDDESHIYGYNLKQVKRYGISKKWFDKALTNCYNNITESDIDLTVTKIVKHVGSSILLASYGTLAVGVNIKNLHCLIFCHPTKGQIRLLQTIGRILRKANDKNQVEVIDIVDNFERVTKKAKFRNTLLKQFVTRLEIYEKQEFDYDIEQVKL